MNEEITRLMALRDAARKEKRYEEADRLREEIEKRFGGEIFDLGVRSVWQDYVSSRPSRRRWR